MMMGGAGVCCDLMRVDLEPMSMASWPLSEKNDMAKRLDLNMIHSAALMHTRTVYLNVGHMHPHGHPGRHLCTQF